MTGGIKLVARCRRRMMIPSTAVVLTTDHQPPKGYNVTVTVKGKQYCVMLSCDYGYYSIGILSVR
jgi:hypothetical protein